jgi:hypothetical protein
VENGDNRFVVYMENHNFLILLSRLHPGRGFSWRGQLQHDDFVLATDRGQPSSVGFSDWQPSAGVGYAKAARSSSLIEEMGSYG